MLVTQKSKTGQNQLAKWVLKHWQYVKWFLTGRMRRMGVPILKYSVKIDERCEELLKTRKFAIESNYFASKFKIVKASVLKKASWVTKTLFEFLLMPYLHSRQDFLRRYSWLKQNPSTMTAVNRNSRKVLSLKNWLSVIDGWKTGVKNIRFP